MGVYYLVVNDTKKEYVDPFYFDDNIKLGGLMQGLHGPGVVELMVYPSTREKYKMGYWAGDQIRMLGDNHEEENESIQSQYLDISFYVLANIFENSIKEQRNEIINRAIDSPEILAGLIKVNSEIKYLNLNYSLNKIIEKKI